MKQPSSQDLYDRAALMEQRGQLQQAAAAYAGVLQQQPDHADAFERFCVIAAGARAFAEIDGLAQRLLGAGADTVRIRNHAGIAAMQIGKQADARKHFGHALQHDPEDLHAKLSLAELCMYEGKRDEAADILVPLIDAGKRDAQLCVLFASLANRLGRAEEALEMLAPHTINQDALPYHRSVASFRTAELLDKLGRYDEAFLAATQANALTTGLYQPGRIDQLDQFILGAFTPEFVSTMVEAEPNAPTPIYICGTPRSGSSLVEAILSAHPRVGSIGEHDLMEPIFRAVIQPGPLRKVPGFETLKDKKSVDRLSSQLSKKYTAMAPGAEFVTDKWLTNYRNVGLIRSMMPHSKVIFMRRDPRDMALSCFMNDLYSARMATTLEDITHTLRRFDRYREHWLSVFDGFILDVSYEELVADLPGQTERILEFVGVDFDEACIRFYETEHATRTLSVDQVRQPIYASSVGRWRNYAEQLQPLCSALGLDDTV